jgi:hypothetical protein
MGRKVAIVLFWILAILVTTIAWSGISLKDLLAGKGF